MKVPRKRWLIGALTLLITVGLAGWWSLSPHGTREGPLFVGLRLALHARPERVVSPLGIPFELRVFASVTAPAGSANGEWVKRFRPLTIDQKRLRFTAPNGPFVSDWQSAFVCVTPHTQTLQLEAELDWRGPGSSGFHDESTGVAAALALPIRCEGPSAPRCGDGLVTHDEECDAEDLLEYELRTRQNNSHRIESLCTLLKKGTGKLRCGSDCRYDTSQCVVPTSCGNGRVDADEACDGADLGVASCGSVGFSTGKLRCRSDCQLDTAECRVLLK